MLERRPGARVALERCASRELRKRRGIARAALERIVSMRVAHSTGTRLSAARDGGGQVPGARTGSGVRVAGGAHLVVGPPKAARALSCGAFPSGEWAARFSTSESGLEEPVCGERATSVRCLTIVPETTPMQLLGQHDVSFPIVVDATSVGVGLKWRGAWKCRRGVWCSRCGHSWTQGASH